MPPTRPGPAPGCRSILSRILALAGCLAGVFVLTASLALAEEPSKPRFDIEVQAPDDIRPFLLRHMDLQRFRLVADLDEAELERLLARAPEDLRGLLGTLGHFSPEIEIRSTAGDSSTAAPLGVVRVSVKPGPPTRVTSARVYLQGDIATNPAAAEQRKRIESDVARIVGEQFTQADWEQVKTQALRQLTGERYPNGRLVNSLADVDAEHQQAHLHIDLDSGPARRLGNIEVQGSDRYDPEQAARLARLAGVVPGSDYSLERLQAAQARISASERYASVLVTVEQDDGDTDLPVLVQVRERPRQKLQLGLGGSTDNGPRLSLEYRHQQVPGIGWQADTRVQLERNDKVAQSVWTAPMDEDAWRWAASGRWAEQVSGVNVTTSQRLRWGRLTQEDTYEQGRYLQFDRARTVTTTTGGEIRQEARSALSANQSWTWRRFSDPVFPERGQGLALELGVGMTLDGTSRPFVRSQARWLVYWPLGGTLPSDTPAAGEARGIRKAIEQGRLGRLALRLEGGTVLARHDTALPDTLLFLAGGDASVRGYGLREIGIERGEDDVVPGRYMAVGSIEWQRPIWRDGRRSPWEHVLFVDGGAVADRQQDLKAQWGVGTGVRYNSPVGPLQLDLAYGLAKRAWRLHLSVGFAF